LPVTTNHERASLAPDVALAVGGGSAVRVFNTLFPDSIHDLATVPLSVSLVSVNSLDAVERPLGGQVALARAKRTAEASLSAVAESGPDTTRTNSDSEWRWDRVAALNTAANAVTSPRRPQWRQVRERKFWPLRRLWLARKQP
jgi:hypothetical protein